jgi:hypothetical protein
MTEGELALGEKVKESKKLHCHRHKPMTNVQRHKNLNHL